MMTPERRREHAETDGLAELFHAAAESRRSTPELMRVILAGALPLAGADVALVCGSDGSLLAFATSEGVDDESARALALEASQVSVRESDDDECESEESSAARHARSSPTHVPVPRPLSSYFV